ncbi:hypothetical protein XBI1_2970023 [Xenorhabdus bovienii str. Intermedium]|uniref:Uncharacterized protein n=1 Tax=Xenorhabdus bovienii str. Intermedium TaxID=1379677 RepID=A0A077QDQ6_XENBV|nr:hypothetical protein XBI1_2970023 [Xenorhabdus bovienii str. Intermedium]
MMQWFAGYIDEIQTPRPPEIVGDGREGAGVVGINSYGGLFRCG